MVSYGVAKARAMASKRNWNEEDARTRVRILFEGEWYADRG